MFKRYRFYLILFLGFALLFGASLGYAQLSPSTDAYAGASVEGQRKGANLRALVTSGGTDRVRRVIYFNTGHKTPVAANTPIVSGAVCELAGEFHWAKAVLTGTLTGTNPTAAIKWQNSKDNGATWTDVGTWTTINATVTPASQENTLVDHGNQSYTNAQGTVTTELAVMYGDCWRASLTFGGTGAIGGNISIIGAEK